MRVSRDGGLGTKALPCPPRPLGLWLCEGVKDSPSLPGPLPPSWFLFPFPGGAGGGRRRVGGGTQGSSWNDPRGEGARACEEGATPAPSAQLPALSHGVLEQQGAGWPDRLACPWGQREGPAQPGVLLGGSARPSPPLPRPRAGNVLFPPLPPRGQRAGRAGLCPTLSSSPPRCGPLPPLTHAAPGLARRWVWAGRASLAESGPAGAPWRPCPSRAGAPSGHLAASPPPPAGERGPGNGAAGKESNPRSLASQALLRSSRPPLYIASSVGLVEI